MSVTPQVEDTGDMDLKVSKIQDSWKNSPSREDLYTDFAQAESGMDEYRNELRIYKETMEGGKRNTNPRPGKSLARPLLARKQAEWRYPALSEPILGTSDLFKVSPVEASDAGAAKQNGMLLNYQWTTKINEVKLVDDIVRNLVDEGTVIVKTGWLVEEGTAMVEKEVPDYASAEESLQIMQEAVARGEMTREKAQAMLEMGEPIQKGTKIVYEEEETLIKNHPTYEVCMNSNITIDPSCNGVLEDAKFAIHTYDTSYAELKADEFVTHEDGSTSGFYHNIDNIMDAELDQYDEFKTVSANNFRFSDKSRKLLKAYEYWGYWDIQGNGVLEAIVATWIGNTLVRLEENPYPHKRIPFSLCTYMPIKRDIHGQPDAALLRENQDAIGNMTRAIHDITAKQAIGQEFIDENFFASPAAKNQYEKGNTVYFRTGFDPKSSIYKSSVQEVGRAPFEVIDWQQREASELTGTRPFNGSQGGGKLGANSQQKDSMDATAKRELSILRRISAMFVDMARMTIAMNQVFLSEEETVRITGDEFVTIRRDDLEGNFDLKVEISTPEKNEDQANKIMKLMQTNAASADPEITKFHYIQLAELWNLPKLADKLKSFKPQPNPKQEELIDLQIEEQKLKNALAMKQLEAEDAKINERLGRGKDDDAKRALTEAKANQANATAEKISSETDVIDASFLMVQSGEKRQQEVQDQEYAAQVSAAKEESKTLAQQGLEHIKQAYIRTPGKTIAEI